MEERMMDEQHLDVNWPGISRRMVVSGLGASAVAAMVAGLSGGLGRASGQEATPETGAEGLPPGIGLTYLLVGGLIHDMPPGSVEVRISRLTAEPGAVLEASSLPYPALMYIEAGTSACPGGPGRIVYGTDGTILDETTEEAIQFIPTGTTQYIPAGISDGAGNQGTELMSSIVIEFVPVDTSATPATGTPGA
jgi:hypothetical protein